MRNLAQLRITRARIVAALTIVAITIAFPFVAFAGGSSGPELPSAPTKPLLKCAPKSDRIGLDPSQAPCTDDAILRDSNDRIIAAKTDAANAYIATLYNMVPPEKYAALESWVLTLTGESGATPEPDISTVSATLGPARLPLDAGARLKTTFAPYQQTRSYYCGPATVESILSFLGPSTSWATDPVTGARDHLTGDPATDQQMFANTFWLDTETNDGTVWGEGAVPYALNAWRGSRWYVADGVNPKLGGTLTKDQALRDIRYDIDHGYPVAENVLYSSETYYPAGFIAGIRYTHWDTIYGYGDINGDPYVNVGQVYHAPSLPYSPYQQVDWDKHWSAVAAWHGIVW